MKVRNKILLIGLLIVATLSFITTTFAVTNNTTTTTTTNTKNTLNTTNTTVKKSNNANLSTLGITPKEYDFTGFKANITEYTVTVPNDVNSVQVAYKTQDANAKVKITGGKELEVGTNKVKVKVTASDGKTTKTYTIKVTKLATEDEKPGNLIDEEKLTGLYLTDLSIKGFELTPEFSSSIYSYEVTMDMDKKDLSEVTVNAVANEDKATIEIVGNKNLVEGENLINVIVKTSTEQKVYQITINKISKISETVTKDGFNIKGIGIAVAIIIVLIILICIIKKRRNNEEYYEDENYFDDTKIWNDSEEETDNLVERLFNERKRQEENTISIEDKKLLKEIQEENDRIFNKPTKGETVEFEDENISMREKAKKLEEYNDEPEEEYVIVKPKRRRGKHF